MINKYVDCVYVGRRLDESRIFDVFIKFGFDDESMNDVSFDYDKNFNVYIVKDVTSIIDNIVYKNYVEFVLRLEIELKSLDIDVNDVELVLDF